MTAAPEKRSLPPDQALLAALRAGDEAAFAQVVDAWSGTLLRLARAILRDASAAEEVVQDAWLAVFDTLDRFEGRSALKTWVCQITVNRARSRAERDRRMTSLDAATDEDREAALFDEAGRWLEPVQEWARPADARLEWAQLRAALESALELLPEAQRLVVVLRDLDGMSGPEVCHALGLSETNQRQLLHRGRARLRATLAAQQVGEQG